MTSALLATLPLQFLFNLIVAGAPAVNDTNFVGGGPTTERLPPTRLEDDGQIETTTMNFTEDYIDATSTKVTPVNLPAGYVRFPDVKAAYKVHEEEGTTWKVARERCIAEGGHLAVTDSVEKVQHINSLKSDSFMWLHVGIHKLTDDSEWVRVDNGLPPSFIPWKEGYPFGDRNCAGISVGGDGLLDYSCDKDGEWYVCEIPI